MQSRRKVAKNYLKVLQCAEDVAHDHWYYSLLVIRYFLRSKLFIPKYRKHEGVLGIIYEENFKVLPKITESCIGCNENEEIHHDYSYWLYEKHPENIRRYCSWLTLFWKYLTYV